MRVLLVSSFVRPHAGGVEEFVDSVRVLLEQQRCEVRVLACRNPGRDASAHAVVPSRFVGASAWPLPTGGWRTLRQEVAAADIVIANNARHPLSALAVVAARLVGRPAVLVIHGSGEDRYAGKRLAGALRNTFQHTVGMLAVRMARPVSVSRVGVFGARAQYGVDADYLPYPLRELPAAAGATAAPRDPFRVVWVGRLSPEKDPVLAVRAMELLRRHREAVLAMYGDGPLRAELDALARERPWLSVLGAREWAEVLDAQGGAHACLATSVADNVQVALLEALSRGVPSVSTRVGDAPAYYARPALREFCVARRDPEQLAAALHELAASYEMYCAEFAENAAELRRRHARAPAELARLLRSTLGRESVRT